MEKARNVCKTHSDQLISFLIRHRPHQPLTIDRPVVVATQSARGQASSEGISDSSWDQLPGQVSQAMTHRSALVAFTILCKHHMLVHLVAKDLRVLENCEDRVVDCEDRVVDCGDLMVLFLPQMQHM